VDGWGCGHHLTEVGQKGEDGRLQKRRNRAGDSRVGICQNGSQIQNNLQGFGWEVRDCICGCADSQIPTTLGLGSDHIHKKNINCCGGAEKNFDACEESSPKVSRLKSHVFSSAEEVLVAMAGIRLGGGGGVNSLIASPGLQKLAIPSPSTTVVAAGCSRFKKLGLKKVSGSRRRPFRISAADVPNFLPATWYDKSVFICTQNSELCIFLSQCRKNLGWSLAILGNLTNVNCLNH
jgi:hypothetical protein